MCKLVALGRNKRIVHKDVNKNIYGSNFNSLCIKLLIKKNKIFSFNSKIWYKTDENLTGHAKHIMLGVYM